MFDLSIVFFYFSIFFFRYLVQTLQSESPKFSYVGVALNKDHYISWILQMKTILNHCLIGLDSLKPEISSDHTSILLRLYTLVSFTSPASWAILKVEGMEKLRTGMSQLCANIMGHLVNNGFYAIMQVTLYMYFNKFQQYLSFYINKRIIFFYVVDITSKRVR